jgi:hypothetical protein
MRALIKYVLLAEAFAVATFAFGWWTVPVIGAAWGLTSRDANRARSAGFAALAGWATLLVLDAVRGPVMTMSERLGAVMGVPGFVLLGITLVFPGALAWAAAVLTSGLASVRSAAAPSP